MLEKLIEWSVKNRFLVIMLTVFVVAAGLWAIFSTPVDAIPDLSDVQVIVYTEFPGQSPRIVEDQVTYPLTTSLLSVPGASVVRGYSFFGYSLVYVIFKDGTNIYWARSRVLEYLNYAQKRLPGGVIPTLGPDATGVGWVYEYALTSEKRSLQELRSYQDWYLKYGLSSIEGVAEVASVGGFVKQYQVTVDPGRLQAFGIPLKDVETAIKGANSDVGGEVIEMGEAEFMIRGLGYIKSIDDIRKIPVKTSMRNGVAIRIGDIADVALGPEMRRGLAELDGQGEVAGGVVVIRFGENAQKVIKAVKEKLETLKTGLPPDVKIVTTYDRSALIERAIANLRVKLVEEMLIVTLVCAIFLFHVQSAAVAVFTLPTAILMAFFVMRMQGLNANIMSLGGIAIAIGAMVDAAIIMIENAHKRIEAENAKPPELRSPHWQVILESSKEVGPPLFYSLLVITVSFLPIFALEAQEGRLFKPLAFTKTYSMAAAAILAVTIVPVLMGFFVRGKIRPEHANPLNRFLISIYRPVVQFVMRYPKIIIFSSIVIVLVTIVPFTKLGSEFMPPLYEGDLLYMPTTLPGVSIRKAKELLQQTDKIIRTFPEVDRVFGKDGRAETATDPAGLDMFETTIQLKPEKRWPKGMTPEKLIQQLDEAIKIPGLTNAWTMPIKARTDMLSTGIKTPVGIKISGANLDTLQIIGRQVEAAVRTVKYTTSAFAERAVGGNYLDVKIDRDKAGRYGLNVDDVQSVIETALGGMSITTTVEGLERYTVNLRYARELRDNVDALRRVLVSSPSGLQIPLGEVASFEINKGPMVIRSEGSRPNAWVFVDMRGTDMGTYLRLAQKTVASQVRVPTGYNVVWSGEYELMQRSQKRLMIVVPLTLFIIFIIIFLNTKSIIKTSIILLAVPFSLVGTVWFLFALGYNMSLAVWVGIIALAGLSAETGVVMLLYLDQAFEAAKSKRVLRTLRDLKEVIDHGAVKRVRPKIMTASVIIAGLLPILWSAGTGSDVMKRIAAPMVGGVVTSVLMELMVFPAIYFLWKRRSVVNDEIRTDKRLP
ncbi:MAG TPA: CusA/CzcA family heavy metal efflux RND transporter [Chitinivibrionales bacterium]|nr:CusA/CzcA family heavy metal efflux RND transporter [Chitinivibrionales bacterium]